MMVFHQGESYWAIPCMGGQERKLVTVTDRRGGRVSFAKPNPMEVSWCSEFDGREVARVRDGDGEYTVSSASWVDLQEALEVMAVVRPHGFRRAARKFFGGGRGSC